MKHYIVRARLSGEFLSEKSMMNEMDRDFSDLVGRGELW